MNDELKTSVFQFIVHRSSFILHRSQRPLPRAVLTCLSACAAPDAEEAPVAGQVVKGVRAALLEGDAGAGDEVFDRVRDEHLARPGALAHGPPELDGESAHAPALQQITLA